MEKRGVNLHVSGLRDEVDSFIIWLWSQPCFIVNVDEKLGPVEMKTIELDLELHFKSEEDK